MLSKQNFVVRTSLLYPVANRKQNLVVRTSPLYPVANRS